MTRGGFTQSATGAGNDDDFSFDSVHIRSPDEVLGQWPALWPPSTWRISPVTKPAPCCPPCAWPLHVPFQVKRCEASFTMVKACEAVPFTHDKGRYYAFSNRGIEVKLASVSLFDCGPFLRP